METPTQAQMIEAFTFAHPWATTAHATWLSNHAGVTAHPFCTECADWHEPAAVHSQVENSAYTFELVSA